LYLFGMNIGGQSWYPSQYLVVSRKHLCIFAPLHFRTLWRYASSVIITIIKWY